MNSCGQETWPATFNAIHMSVIPVDTSGAVGGINHRGDVIVWDQPAPGDGCQRWAILDPLTGQAWNYWLALPPGTNRFTGSDLDGDIFCSSHVWTKDGYLAVFGGTVYEPEPPPPDSGDDVFSGARLVYLWNPMGAHDPNSGNQGYGWTLLTNALLEVPRYYPGAMMTGEDTVMVAGGIDLYGNYVNPGSSVNQDYEVFVPDSQGALTGGWHTRQSSQAYAGPDPVNGGGYFNYYPRTHLLSDGRVLYTGFARDNGRVRHVEANAPVWDHSVAHFAPPVGEEFLHYGSSVLQPINFNLGTPNVDRVMRLGGAKGQYVFAAGMAAVKTVETCNLQSGTMAWQPAGSMNRERMYCNAVLLPDATTFVAGGTTTSIPVLLTDYVMTGEVLNEGVWLETGAMASRRDYHATEVLLPNGAILMGGGNGRDVDYQIYWPRYFYKAAQGWPTPHISAISSTTLSYGQQYYLDWSMVGSGSADSVVTKVVLTRPCSVTHHSDFEQRYLALEQVIVPGAPFDRIHFKAPPGPDLAPRGHYMLWAVSDKAIPSVAAWVEIR